MPGLTLFTLKRPAIPENYLRLYLAHVVASLFIDDNETELIPKLNAAKGAVITLLENSYAIGGILCSKLNCCWREQKARLLRAMMINQARALILEHCRRPDGNIPHFWLKIMKTLSAVNFNC